MSISAARKGVRLDTRQGTTLIEVVVALSIASILMGITINTLKGVSSARSASAARDTYVWMARRARASAIQLGTRVNVVLTPSLGRASVIQVKDGKVLEQVELGKEFGATITGFDGALTITFDPRGIGYPSATPTIAFSQGANSSHAQVQGLGQVVAQ